MPDDRTVISRAEVTMDGMTAGPGALTLESGGVALHHRRAR
jgi:hypothetical protein